MKNFQEFTGFVITDIGTFAESVQDILYEIYTDTRTCAGVKKKYTACIKKQSYKPLGGKLCLFIHLQ
jgi:hypothetical protein